MTQLVGDTNYKPNSLANVLSLVQVRKVCMYIYICMYALLYDFDIDKHARYNTSSNLYYNYSQSYSFIETVGGFFSQIAKYRKIDFDFFYSFLTWAYL